MTFLRCAQIFHFSVCRCPLWSHFSMLEAKVICKCCKLLAVERGPIIRFHYIRDSKLWEHFVELWYDRCRGGWFHSFHHWVPGVVVSNQKEILFVWDLSKVNTNFFPRRCWEWRHLQGFSLALGSSNQAGFAWLHLAFNPLINVREPNFLS